MKELPVSRSKSNNIIFSPRQLEDAQGNRDKDRNEIACLEATLGQKTALMESVNEQYTKQEEVLANLRNELKVRFSYIC